MDMDCIGMSEWETYWWFCNTPCRVVEFYANDESETVCPSCGAPGSLESE